MDIEKTRDESDQLIEARVKFALAADYYHSITQRRGWDYVPGLFEKKGEAALDAALSTLQFSDLSDNEEKILWVEMKKFWKKGLTKEELKFSKKT